MPAVGRLRFSDGEGQLEAPTSSNNLRSSFQNDFEQKMERIQTASRKFAIPVLPLDTINPVADQLRDAFGHHQSAKRF